MSPEFDGVEAAAYMMLGIMAVTGLIGLVAAVTGLLNGKAEEQEDEE
jgi:hypothetical protein